MSTILTEAVLLGPSLLLIKSLRNGIEMRRTGECIPWHGRTEHVSSASDSASVKHHGDDSRLSGLRQ